MGLLSFSEGLTGKRRGNRWKNWILWHPLRLYRGIFRKIKPEGFKTIDIEILVKIYGLWQKMGLFHTKTSIG